MTQSFLSIQNQTSSPIDTTYLKPEDLGRRVATVHVAATCERYSYHSAPRRRIFWHVFLKFSGSGGASESTGTGAYDAVEIFKLFPTQHYFVTSTSMTPSYEAALAREKLVFMSRPYPDFDASGSLDELRFLCRLVPESLVTVREVIEALAAAQNEEPSVALLADGDNESEDPYAGTAVGGMAWCVDAIRALQGAGLLTLVSYDKLMIEFEGSRYRWEFVQGYTVIV